MHMTRVLCLFLVISFVFISHGVKFNTVMTRCVQDVNLLSINTKRLKKDWRKVLSLFLRNLRQDLVGGKIITFR